MYIGTRNFHSFSILTENELEIESAWSSMNPVKLKMKFCKKDTWVGVFDRGRWGWGGNRLEAVFEAAFGLWRPPI